MEKPYSNNNIMSVKSSVQVLKKEMSDASSFSTPVLGNVSIGASWKVRRQTLAMFTCSLYFIIPMNAFCWVLTISLVYTSRITAVLIACYLGFIFFMDKSHTNGARYPFLRAFKSWWSDACDYLPLLLVKTASLDPEKRYVLGYHPHGIISVGAFCAFATDGARTLSLVPNETSKAHREHPTRGFSSLFPGIDRRIVTLPQNFMTPFLREYFLFMGAVDSDKATFRNVLSRKSTALIVVVGGAAESMIVKNHAIDLVLEKRRGFVREAIRANACLVPVIGFGESDLYQVFETDETQWIARLQRFVKRTTGFAMPIFRGRSIFLQDFGVMPMRTPVCVVVGAPIDPPLLTSYSSFQPLIDGKSDKPLNKDGQILLEWHEKYVIALTGLHKLHEDANWNKPGQQRRSSLKVVQ